MLRMGMDTRPKCKPSGEAGENPDAGKSNNRKGATKMNANDREVVSKMYNSGNYFDAAIANAMYHADRDKLDRIKAAFPEIIERYRPASPIVTPPPITATTFDFRGGPS